MNGTIEGKNKATPGPNRIAIGMAVVLLVLAAAVSCITQPEVTPDSSQPMAAGAKAIFLHHSTGGVVWGGGVETSFASLNSQAGTSYQLNDRSYPDTPWPWANYPSDYYRLWIGTEGSDTTENIQTLDGICAGYDLVIWKHCFPVGDIGPDTGNADPGSDTKTLENYRAAYEALKTKMHSMTGKRFIVWTGAVHLQVNTSPDQAQRLKEFRDWVVNTWDEKGDNIFIFDFWSLETGGGLYLLPGLAASPGDDHPNDAFAQANAPKFAKRVFAVLTGQGDTSSLTGD